MENSFTIILFDCILYIFGIVRNLFCHKKLERCIILCVLFITVVVDVL